MPSYPSTESPVTEELIRAILEDFNRHLESRLEQTRVYMERRVRERIKELIPDSEGLLLRRMKKQPVIPDWRIPGGEFSPDERRDMLRRTGSN